MTLILRHAPQSPFETVGLQIVYPLDESFRCPPCAFPLGHRFGVLEYLSQHVHLARQGDFAIAIAIAPYTALTMLAERLAKRKGGAS